jgi:hypothetical protein
MTERAIVTVPDLVGQPVDIASEIAAGIGLVLSSGHPDGPGYPLAYVAGTLRGDRSGSFRGLDR